jgi:hypothetical protein
MTGAADLNPARAAQLATDAGAANEAVQYARLLLGTGQARDEEGRSLDDHLFDAQERTRRLYRALLTVAPPELPELPDVAAAPIPLDLLASPAARRLLALLEEAQEAAEQVDFERGRSLPEDIPLQPGESRGTDLAEIISEIALQVRTEVQGPKGRE